MIIDLRDDEEAFLYIALQVFDMNAITQYLNDKDNNLFLFEVAVPVDRATVEYLGKNYLPIFETIENKCYLDVRPGKSFYANIKGQWHLAVGLQHFLDSPKPVKFREYMHRVSYDETCLAVSFLVPFSKPKND